MQDRRRCRRCWTVKESVRGHARQIVVVVIVSLAGSGGGACTTPRPDKHVANPDPLGKIPAYKQAVRAKDRKAAAQMVKDLHSTDPAVRMFAIGGLRRLTGETLGYRYFDGDDDRRAAAKRWEQWLAGDDPRPQRQAQPQDAAIANDGAADAPSGAPDGASGP